MLWGLTPAIRRPVSRQWTDRPEALRCWLELIEAELSKFFFDPVADPRPDYFHNGVGWIRGVHSVMKVNCFQFLNEGTLW